MAAKKSKNKRYYHADGYTYDEYFPSGMTISGATDPVRSKFDDERSKKGAVGPERIQDYVRRLDAQSEYIAKNPKLRVLDTSENKARGSSSSSVRRIIK